MARFGHISGDPVLDLVNTVEWRLSDELREEDLNEFADVVAWCRESALLTANEADRVLAAAGSDASEELARVIALREALYRALFDPDADSHRILDEEVHQAIDAAEYGQRAGIWGWADRDVTAATPRHRIARGILTLLARDDLNRLHQCEDADCGWVFIDTSRTHNRRWCATKDCGDRNRSRAYYARQKANS